MSDLLDLDAVLERITVAEMMMAQQVLVPVCLEEAIAAVVENHLLGKGKAADDKRAELVKALSEQLMGLPVHQLYLPQARVAVDTIELGNAVIEVDANGDLVSVTCGGVGGYVCWDYRD